MNPSLATSGPQVRDLAGATVADVPSCTAPAPLVSVDGLSIRFGGITALSEVTFDIRAGEILGLIGPNGAGKTTLFNCLTRLQHPTSGDVRVDGRSILKYGPHYLARLGVARTFQNLALFAAQSVLDNVRIGAHYRVRGGWLGDALGLPAARRREEEIDSVTWQVLDRLELRAHAHRRVGELAFGLQKRVELARALALRPRLLLLDEPAGGLNHGDVDDLGQMIRQLQAEYGLSILLVEHHMGLMMSTADRVVALNFGRKIAEGTPAEVQCHSEVIQAYLGGRSKEAA